MCFPRGSAGAAPSVLSGGVPRGTSPTRERGGRENLAGASGFDGPARCPHDWERFYPPPGRIAGSAGAHLRLSAAAGTIRLSGVTEAITIHGGCPDAVVVQNPPGRGPVRDRG